MGIKVKKEEDDQVIIDAAETLSDYFGTCYTAIPRRITGPARQSTKGNWTEREDHLLIESVTRFHGRNWKKISECLPQRTVSQCFSRWNRVLNPAVVKGAWTKEEDDCIIKSVRKYGPRKWSVIAKSLPGRLGKQCRERWYNHLDPAIRKTSWTEEEELTLIQNHETYGNKWIEIAKFLPGRTDNAIKNHWNCILKKNNLGSNSPASSLNSSTDGSLNFCYCLTQPYNMDMEEDEEMQNIDETISVDRRMRLNNIAELSTSVSPPGIGDGVHNQVEPNYGVVDPSESSVEAYNFMNRLHYYDERGAKDCDVTSENYGKHDIELKDLISGLDSTEFPTGHNHLLHINSPFSCATPTDVQQGSIVNCYSPESILRHSARTFKNTPSIIRKRTYRKANADNSSNITHTSMRKNSCIRDSENVRSADISNSEKGILSFFSKPDSSAIKSLTRRLDHEFNLARDVTTGGDGPDGETQFLQLHLQM